MSFVLDNSVTMRWLLKSSKPSDQAYAESVLTALIDVDAYVPSLWHLEVGNVLINAEKYGDLKLGDSEGFISRLESLPIYVDEETANKALNRTLNMAREYKLSSYDVAYLELAIRKGMPIATLDKDLRKAAVKANVSIFQVS